MLEEKYIINFYSICFLITDRWQEMSKEEIIDKLNEALTLEHMAFTQYLSHAELVDGKNAEPIIARLKEIAEDEKQHQEDFREMIGYLDGVPTTETEETHEAETIHEILDVNLMAEIEALELYKKIQKKIKQEKEELPYEFWQLEHHMRHIIMDEQEHVLELRTLMGLTGDEVEEEYP